MDRQTDIAVLRDVSIAKKHLQLSWTLTENGIFLHTQVIARFSNIHSNSSESRLRMENLIWTETKLAVA